MKPSDIDMACTAPEQARYAKMLAAGTWAGLAVLVVGFVAYAFEWYPALVPLDELPRLWNQSLPTYLAQTGIPTGWGWLRLADRADIFNLVGIGILSGISILCLVAIAPLYAARGERAYLAICMLEVLVLLLAASGILTSGH